MTTSASYRHSAAEFVSAARPRFDWLANYPMGRAAGQEGHRPAAAEAVAAAIVQAEKDREAGRCAASIRAGPAWWHPRSPRRAPCCSRLRQSELGGGRGAFGCQ